MHGPVLVGWLLVGLCGATGGYCLTRLRAGRPRTGAAEAAMGLGMAVMALPAGAHGRAAGLLGPGVALLCGGTTLWACAVLGYGAVHRTHHLVETVAMLHMGLAMTLHPAASPTSGHAAVQEGAPALLTGLLLAYFGGYALCQGPRLLPAAASARHGAGGGVERGGGTGGAPVPAGELVAACRLTLALAMFAMLLTL